MGDPKSYAVFLYPQAIEVLAEPIKPYLRDAAGGPHIVCAEIDASGPLFEMTWSERDRTPSRCSSRSWCPCRWCAW